MAAISPEQFNAQAARYYTYYAQKERELLKGNSDFYGNIITSNIRTIPPDERHCIDTVLQQADIDKKIIDVVYCEYTKPHCGFSAGVSTIYIDPKKIPSNQNLYKSIGSHELVHAIFADAAIAGLVKAYCNKDNKNFRSKYKQFRERRADILGCLLSSSHAHALSLWFKDMPRHLGPPTHPECCVRTSYLYKLYTETDQDYIRREKESEQERQEPLYGFCPA